MNDRPGKGENPSLILRKRRMKDFDLEAEDWSDLMDRCRKQDAEKPYNWEIIIQLLAAGARKGEVLRLIFADLDMNQDGRTIEVSVPTKKNHNRRYLVHMAGIEVELAPKLVCHHNLIRTFGQNAPVFRPDADRGRAKRILSDGVRELLSHVDR